MGNSSGSPKENQETKLKILPRKCDWRRVVISQHQIFYQWCENWTKKKKWKPLGNDCLMLCNPTPPVQWRYKTKLLKVRIKETSWALRMTKPKRCSQQNEGNFEWQDEYLKWWCGDTETSNWISSSHCLVSKQSHPLTIKLGSLPSIGDIVWRNGTQARPHNKAFPLNATIIFLWKFDFFLIMKCINNKQWNGEKK